MYKSFKSFITIFFASPCLLSMSDRLFLVTETGAGNTTSSINWILLYNINTSMYSYKPNTQLAGLHIGFEHEVEDLSL